MASDEPTSDESDESNPGESGESNSDGSGDTSLDDSSSEDGDSASEESLDFGAGAEATEGEPKTSSKDGESEEANSEAKDSEAKEEEYDPTKIPPLSERATLFGAWGCVGLLVVVLLIFFILIKSAIDKIDYYGAVVSEDTREDSGEELPPEELEEPETPEVTRTLEWPTTYPEARAAARIDLRPIVVVFTAEYATESIDVFDGVFGNIDIENYLDRFYQVVHIDMGAQGQQPDPSIALCEVEFLPHVCYLHPETEEKLNDDTTGMVGTGALLRQLAIAHAAYEATAEAD